MNTGDRRSVGSSEQQGGADRQIWKLGVEGDARECYGIVIATSDNNHLTVRKMLGCQAFDATLVDTMLAVPL